MQTNNPWSVWVWDRFFHGCKSLGSFEEDGKKNNCEMEGIVCFVNLDAVFSCRIFYLEENMFFSNVFFGNHFPAYVFSFRVVQLFPYFMKDTWLGGRCHQGFGISGCRATDHLSLVLVVFVVLIQLVVVLGIDIVIFGSSDCRFSSSPSRCPFFQKGILIVCQKPQHYERSI